MPETFKESPSNFGNAVWNTLETGGRYIRGSNFLRSSADYYPKHHSPRVNAKTSRRSIKLAEKRSY